MIDKRLAEVEEKYDLNAAAMLEGFSQEDEDGNTTESSEEETITGEEAQEDF